MCVEKNVKQKNRGENPVCREESGAQQFPPPSQAGAQKGKMARQDLQLQRVLHLLQSREMAKNLLASHWRRSRRLPKSKLGPYFRQHCRAHLVKHSLAKGPANKMQRERDIAPVIGPHDE